MSKKYVIANIRLPVEMLEDGTMKTHTDRADIQFETCDELPPINQTQNMTAFANLQDILTKGTEKGTEKGTGKGTGQGLEKGTGQGTGQGLEKGTEKVEQESEPELTNALKLIINKDELYKEKKRSMSTTFRNSPSSSHNYTAKKR